MAAERLDPIDPVAAALLGWRGRADAGGDALPLRFAGGLHALVLSRRDEMLAAVYPPAQTDDASLWRAIAAACRCHSEFLVARLASAPQTNEVRRSAALLPAFLTLSERFGMPLVLSEVGASAGLNLQFDRYHYRLGEATYGKSSSVEIQADFSSVPPQPSAIAVAERRGCDLNPLDAASPADRLDLLSFIWADQADRLVRTQAALELAAKEPPQLDRADAIDWLTGRLRSPYPGRMHVLFHTIAWQYLPADAQARGEALIAAAGARATEAAPFARLAVEADGSAPGAGITLQLWPGATLHRVGRADFHGRWVDWKGLA